MTICGDYFAGNVGLVPKRIRRANPRAIDTRFVIYVLSLDLTPEPDDDERKELGAWSVWDLCFTVMAQIPDDTGDDLILGAANNRIYVLDWTRFRDEWNWEVFGAIYRRITFAPIPSSSSGPDGQDPNAYRKDHLRRFRGITFDVNTIPTDADSKFRITVNEPNKYARFRQGVFSTHEKNRAQVALSNAIDFEVTIEHEANEQFDPRFFVMKWDSQHRRIRSNAQTS